MPIKYTNQLNNIPINIPWPEPSFMPPRETVAWRVAWWVPGETSATPSAPVPSPLAAERGGETREGEGEAHREFVRDGRALSRREVT
jgi:hypothetical protein